MPFIPSPNTVQFEQIFTYSGSTIEMVHHYQFEVTPTTADCEAMHVQARTDWSNTLIAELPSTLVWIQSKFTDLTTQTGFVYITATSLPFAGASASAQLPNNCAVVVTKRTAKRGRSFRGRSYMPGLTEENVNANSVLSTFTTPVLNFFNSIRDLPTTGNPVVMVVLSRIQNGVPLAQGVVTPVTNFTVDTVVDSQRRRLPLRGQ